MSYPKIFGPQGEPYEWYVWDRYAYPKLAALEKTYISDQEYPTDLTLSYYRQNPWTNPDAVAINYFLTGMGTALSDEAITRWLATGRNLPGGWMQGGSVQRYLLGDPVAWGRDEDGVYLMGQLGTDEPGEPLSEVQSRKSDTYPENGRPWATSGVWFVRRAGGEGAFAGNGYGLLSDAVSCKVTQTLAGRSELTLTYPQAGEQADRLLEGAVVVCKPDAATDPQPYRLYRSAKPLQGTVTWYGRHLAYDMSGIPVSPFTAQDAQEALAAIGTHAMIDCDFSFETDVTATADLTVSEPASAFAVLGKAREVYGGDVTYDWRTVRLQAHRGSDRHVVIRYGKNLLTADRDRTTDGMYSGVVAWWQDSDQTVTGPVVDVSGTFAVQRVLLVDVSQDFDAAPTQTQLQTAAADYIAAHELAIPQDGWKISFAMLGQSAEYADLAMLEDVALGDTVTVVLPGGQVQARVVETVWDVLLDRYDSITLGRPQESVAAVIAGQSAAIKQAPTRAWTETVAKGLAKIAMGAQGGAVRLLDTDGDGTPDELYVADNEDPALAQKVIRLNYEGMAFSTSGYNGPWTVGITIDGHIYAWMITAAQLVAGYIRSTSGDMEINLDEGRIFTVARKTYAAADYSAADVTRIQNIRAGRITPTEADYAKYDFYGDGKITVSDVIVCQAIVNSGTDLALTWQVVINPGETGSCLKVVRTCSGAMTSSVTTFAAGAGATRAHDLDVAGAMTVTGNAAMEGDLAVAGGLTVGGNAVVKRQVIGYFVYGRNGSYNAGIFIPAGVSGNFQISSNDWWCGFYFSNGSASYQTGAGTNVDLTVVTVYNGNT